MKAKVLTIALLLGLGQTAAAAPDIKEGLWEVTAQMEMPGMPIKLPPVTRSQCITKENLVPDNVQKHGDCKVAHSEVNSNTVSWTVTCETSEGTMTGNGEIVYQQDSFEGGFNMNVDSSEGPMTMASKMSGRYMGACQ